MVMKMKTEDEWEVEEAARTLVRAEEIKKNKKLMAKVQAELKRKAEATAQAMKTEEKVQKKIDEVLKG